MSSVESDLLNSKESMPEDESKLYGDSRIKSCDASRRGAEYVDPLASNTSPLEEEEEEEGAEKIQKSVG